MPEAELPKPEPEQDLVVEHDLTGLLKPVALVEPEWATVALAGARPEHVDLGSSAEVLNDQVECCRAQASPLVALVNEQLPEVVGDVFGAVDLVGNHHKADLRLVGIDAQYWAWAPGCSVASSIN